MRPVAHLALADGTVLRGEGAGFVPASGVATGELVFNTAMSGYQEVLTDPSYAGQVVAFTTPHVGNYGVTPLDEESPRPACTGLVVRDLSAASRRAGGRSAPLEAFLVQHRIPAICGVDTRRLTRRVRAAGAMGCAFGTAPADELLAAAAAAPTTDGRDLVTGVTCTAPYTVGRGPAPASSRSTTGSRRRWCASSPRASPSPSCPRRPRPHEIRALEPDGVFLSNGPGDPAALAGPRDMIAALLGDVPIFGICLGQQVLAEALGASDLQARLRPPRLEPPGPPPRDRPRRDDRAEPQLRRGPRHARRGAGHPRQPQRRGRRGVLRARGRARFCVQYHPEAGPGPHDARYLFDVFVALCDGRRHGRALMPRRDDLESILVIGSGPIVIGQACEFDYSGTQACRVLREEGYRVVLVNSNPATIMTDPTTADATYVEPLDADVIEAIIERERPDALLPDARRTDGAQPHDGARRQGRARRARRRGDRRAPRGDRDGRGPRAVPRRDARDRARDARGGLRAQPGPGDRDGDARSGSPS